MQKQKRLLAYWHLKRVTGLAWVDGFKRLAPAARIFRENSKASWKAGHSEGSPDPTADGDTARRRPCTIM